MKHLRLALLLSAFSVSLLWAQAPEIPVCDDATAPTITSEKTITCAGQVVILRSSGCTGTVVWSNGKEGTNLTTAPTKTTSYTAYCKKENCRSKNSNTWLVTVNIPKTPVLNTNIKEICYSQTAKLTAIGCTNDEVIWSNGDKGAEITVRPLTTTRYTATCKSSEGCISCFADDLEIKVKDAGVLNITATNAKVCAGQNVTLSATCDSPIEWSDGTKGNTLTVKPTITTTYSAKCASNGCGAASGSRIIEVGKPNAPVIKFIGRSTICKGETAVLLAQGCSGTVVWTNNENGTQLNVKPSITSNYAAICEQGDCRSELSNTLAVTVGGDAPAAPAVNSTITNQCPYQTVDLSAAFKTTPPAGMTYEPHTTASPSSAIVEQSSAVFQTGVYYLFTKNSAGCYSSPSAVNVTIQNCTNALPICMSFTPKVEVFMQPAGANYRLVATLSGAAKSVKWTTNGSGTLQHADSTQAIYIPSATDYQAGTITVVAETNDPDGSGPCLSVKATQELRPKKPNTPNEMIGVSKYMNNWLRLGDKKFSVSYNIMLTNMGAHDLVTIKLLDSLDKVFKTGAVIVGTPKVTVLKTGKSKITADTTFTGQQPGRYDALVPALSELLKGDTAVVAISMTIDATRSTDSVFYNTAFVEALDINGTICRDASTNGKNPDPDGDGDPSNNTDATPVRTNGGGEGLSGLFIPMGFSPNGDGINDNFVIQKEANIQVEFEVYNRWGGVVYSAKNYKNDWSGVTNLNQNTLEPLPVGTYFYLIKLSDGRQFSRFMTISR
jgi:gliding motility-associated-like protein